MAKYSKKASEKVGKVLHEFKEGELKSSSGQIVRSRKQAIAIGLSEAREAGAKVPMPKKKVASRASATGKSRASTAKRTSATKKKATKKKAAK